MQNPDKKKKILVVDDDEIFLSLVELMLKDDYETTVLRSGKEALDRILQGYVPDLILLDILMPTMDGWETFNRLKAITMLTDVPVVFMTSMHETAERDYAKELGAKDYLLKPFGREELLKRIKSIFG